MRRARHLRSRRHEHVACADVDLLGRIGDLIDDDGHVPDAEGAEQPVHALQSLAEPRVVLDRGAFGAGTQLLGAQFEFILVGAHGDRRRGDCDECGCGSDESLAELHRFLGVVFALPASGRSWLC